MPRYKICIEYDGGPFCGWQMQDGQKSVQGQIVKAVSAFSQEAVVVKGAGRTDTGVHATGQVAHIDFAQSWAADRICGALNYHLKPDPISILSVEEVSEEFDARFSATMRHYHYRIINRKAPLAIEAGRAWHVPLALDVKLMAEAANLLLGRHDFTTFRSVNCQAKSPVKTLEAIKVERMGDEINISLSARSFMHRQVRSIAGCLQFVGGGKWQVEDISAALKAQDRSACAPIAPAHGLYLTGVDYD